MRKGVCIHYNGMSPNETCKKGHAYLVVARPKNEEEISASASPIFALYNRLPCVEKNCVGGCSDYRLPTDTEVAGFDKKIDLFVDKFLKQMNIVRPLILTSVREKGGEKKFIEGSITCPICEVGQVFYTYHGHVNGHVHAECTTENCVRWTE